MKNTSFNFPTIPEWSLGFFFISAFVILMFPLPTEVLSFFVAGHFAFALVVCMLSLYSSNLASLSSLPPLILLSSLGRSCIAINFLMQVFYQTSLMNRFDRIHEDLTMGFMNFCSPTYLALILQIASLFFLSGGLLVGILIASQILKPSRTQGINLDKNFSDETTRTHNAFQAVLVTLGLEISFNLLLALIFVMLKHSPDTGISIDLNLQNMNFSHLDPISGGRFAQLLFILQQQVSCQIIPILLLTLGIGILLFKPQKKETMALANIFFNQLNQLPYPLLFSGMFLSLIAFMFIYFTYGGRGIFFGMQLLFISMIFTVLSFSVFLAADVQRCIDDGVDMEETSRQFLEKVRQQYPWLYKLLNFLHAKRPYKKKP